MLGNYSTLNLLSAQFSHVLDPLSVTLELRTPAPSASLLFFCAHHPEQHSVLMFATGQAVTATASFPGS